MVARTGGGTPIGSSSTSGHHLRPIRATDVDLDMHAVLASQARLWSIYGASWGWPPAMLTLEQDREDLADHETEMEQGASFNYALFDTGEPELPGGRLRLTNPSYAAPTRRSRGGSSTGWSVGRSAVSASRRCRRATVTRTWRRGPSPASTKEDPRAFPPTRRCRCSSCARRGPDLHGRAAAGRPGGSTCPGGCDQRRAGRRRPAHRDDERPDPGNLPRGDPGRRPLHVALRLPRPAEQAARRRDELPRLRRGDPARHAHRALGQGRPDRRDLPRRLPRRLQDPANGQPRTGGTATIRR